MRHTTRFLVPLAEKPICNMLADLEQPVGNPDTSAKDRGKNGFLSFSAPDLVWPWSMGLRETAVIAALFSSVLGTGSTTAAIFVPWSPVVAITDVCPGAIPVTAPPSSAVAKRESSVFQSSGQ